MIKTFVLAVALALAGKAWASPPVQIEYNLVGDWYYYTVMNNLSGDLQDFVVYFPEVSDTTGDVMNYTLLAAGNPAGWTSLLTQPSAINLGGMVEWSGGVIAPGGSKSGFTAGFNYTGTNPLGSQYFEVYDADWNLVDSGYTTPQQQGVPDSGSTLACVLLAIAGLSASRIAARRRISRA